MDRRDTNESLYDDSFSDSDDSWIEWFCNLDGNQFLCEVDEDYINNDFNLYGLANYFDNYDEALDTILSKRGGTSWGSKKEVEIANEAKLLYGLIHARYILTSSGMRKMFEKFKRGEFGACPRVMCNVCSQAVRLFGLSCRVTLCCQ